MSATSIEDETAQAMHEFVSVYGEAMEDVTDLHDMIDHPEKRVKYEKEWHNFTEDFIESMAN